MNTTLIAGPGLDAAGAVRPAEARNIEDPTKPLSYHELAALISGGTSSSGPPVTEHRSLRIPAVWACVQLISRAIARMPLITYRRVDAGRERATDHRLYRPLAFRPNPDMSAFACRQALMANTLLWGNGYAEILRNRAGQPAGLSPIESVRVRPFRKDGELRYDVAMASGGTVTLLKRDMLHIPGLSFDGTCGLSVIAYARETFGTALSRSTVMANLYRRGLRPAGVLEHPGVLKSPAIENLRKSFSDMYGGPENAGKPMILEEGMKWAQFPMIPPEDAQFIEASYLEIEDIARLYGCPPHKIGHLLRATNNNIEYQGLEFLSDTLAPWTEVIEQEANYKLFDDAERDEYYCEHLTQAIVQLDVNARVALYKGLQGLGAMNAGEIRERENLNQIPDGRGEVYFVPSTMMPAPTPEEASKLTAAWIAKGSSGAAGGGNPQPQADGQVAGAA